VLYPGVEVRDGDYADLEGASLVMITAGVNERPAAPPTAVVRRAD
jgi:malate/lactate dehydrogenase